MVECLTNNANRTAPKMRVLFRKAATAAAIALVLGLVLLVGRLSRMRLLRRLAVAVIEFLRGAPTLLLIYVCFLVLPPWGSSSVPTGC